MNRKENFYYYLYLIWIIISTIIFIIILYIFYPNYGSDNEFPLFTDITLIIFLPAYFSIAYLIVHFIDIFLTRTKLKIVLISLVLIGFFVFNVVLIMNFSIITNIVISIIFLIISFVYYIITKLLFIASSRRSIKTIR